MKQNIFKTPIQLLCSLLVALMFAACGGGGGSGSGALPQKLTISTSNTSSSNALTEDSVIHVKLDDKSGFNARLGDVDITSLFVNDGDGTDDKKRKVSVYALQGLLAGKEKATLTAKVSGSRTEELKFRYEGKPELVFGVVEGDGVNEAGNCAADEFPYDNKCVSQAPSTVGLVTNETRPSVGDDLTVKGVVRNALAESIDGGLLVDLLATGPESAFENDGALIIFPLANDAEEADFSFEVTAKNLRKNRVNIAVPGKVISDIFALQISEMGNEHVINDWINDTIKSYLENASENPIQVVRGSPEICEIITLTYGLAPNPNLSSCDMYITSVTTSSGSLLSFSNSVKFTPMKAYRSPALLQHGWNMEANLSASERLDVELTVEALDANQDLMATATFNAKVTNINVKAGVNVGKPTSGDSVFALEVDYREAAGSDPAATDSLVVDYGLSAIVPRPTCVIEQGSGWAGSCTTLKQNLGPAGEADIKKEIKAATAGIAACMQAYAESDFNVDPLSCGFAGTLPEKIGSSLSKHYRTPVFLDASVNVANKVVVSGVENKIEDSRFVSESNQKAGFISFDGWQKTSDNGVVLNALGTHFSPTPTTQTKVKRGQLDSASANDVSLAISSNWINQALLAAYQSNQLGGEGTLALCTTVDEDEKGCAAYKSLINGGVPIVLGAIKSQASEDPIFKSVADSQVTAPRVKILLENLILEEDEIGYRWSLNKVAPYAQFTADRVEFVARELNLRAWLDAAIADRLSGACEEAFKHVNIGKDTIINLCKKALDNKLLPASEEGTSFDVAYIDVPSADIKIRLKNTPNGIKSAISPDDVAIYINDEVKGTYTIDAMTAQSAIIPSLGRMIASLPTQLLADSTHCIVRSTENSTKRSLLDAFFDWGEVISDDGTKVEQREPRVFSLLTSQMQTDKAEADNGEASHIIVAAQLKEGLVDQRLTSVSLEYKVSCL